MTLHTEVMWRQPGFPAVLPGLIKAGLTRENDLACLRSDITRFMQIWKTTPVEMTLNTRRKYVLENGSLRSRQADPGFHHALIEHISAEGDRLGRRYMVGNHSLSRYSVLDNKKYQDPDHILHALQHEHLRRGTPVYFQAEVFTAAIVDELVREAVGLGASLVELPNDITPEEILSPDLQELRARLITPEPRRRFEERDDRS